jgi:hypothetical protein
MEDDDLVYGGAWGAAVENHGAVLDHIIRGHCVSAVDVLDCACGIGTHALGTCSVWPQSAGN